MICEVTIDDALYICRHMREVDWQDITAISDVDTRERWALQIMSTASVKWTAKFHDEPVLIGGLTHNGPSNLELWFIATDKWRKVHIEWTRFLVHAICPNAFKSGIRRLSASINAARKDSRDYVERAGMVYEGTRRWIGRNDESFEFWRLTEGEFYDRWRK